MRAASRSVESSKQLAKKASKASSDGIDKNPLAIVAGGIALGAIIGMLLPKTQREKKVLGKAGKVINETAMNADVTSTFTKSTVSVEGANGYSAKDYNVWVFEPAVAYGNAAVLKVTLG